MKKEIGRMAVEVAEGLARRELAACTVTLKVRYADFTTLTRSRPFSFPVCSAPRSPGSEPACSCRSVESR